MRAAIGDMGAPEEVENEQPWQKLIRMYAIAIGPTPEPEQALLLKFFKEAGDDLPICDRGQAGWFHKAWRQVDVIFSSGMGSKDMVVWNLMHNEPVIWTVLDAMWPDNTD